MKVFEKSIASCIGIGFAKGGGTIAAAFAVLLWFEIPSFHKSWVLPVVTLLVILVGTWAASGVEGSWGKDSSRVVIDEVAGMCISLVFLECTVTVALGAFVLFRFFDIAKPFYIRKMEQLPGGLGVMMDDVLAGVYTNLLLQIAVRAKTF